jgi:putative Mn2+ efflux pump MntP
VLALLLLAVALGLSNFAAAIGIGVRGGRRRAMVRIAGDQSELVASILLIAVGMAIAAGVL